MSTFSEDPNVWIAQLMQCKPLSEGEVKSLCDKVSLDWWAGMIVNIKRLGHTTTRKIKSFAPMH